MHKVHAADPIFGVDYVTEEKAPIVQQPALPRVQDDITIVDTDSHESYATYYADTNKNTDRRPVYNQLLGLAVEELPEGISIEKLWQGGLI